MTRASSYCLGPGTVSRLEDSQEGGLSHSLSHCHLAPGCVSWDRAELLPLGPIIPAQESAPGEQGALYHVQGMGSRGEEWPGGGLEPSQSLLSHSPTTAAKAQRKRATHPASHSRVADLRPQQASSSQGLVFPSTPRGLTWVYL